MKIEVRLSGQPLVQNTRFFPGPVQELLECLEFKIQALQIAKAQVDHQNITYLMALLEHIEQRLPRAE